MRRQFGMPLHHRHGTRTPALVGRRELGSAPKREGRHDVDREGGRVIVKTTMHTSGFTFAIHSFDFSYPPKTRVQ